MSSFRCEKRKLIGESKSCTDVFNAELMARVKRMPLLPTKTALIKVSKN